MTEKTLVEIIEQEHQGPPRPLREFKAHEEKMELMELMEPMELMEHDLTTRPRTINITNVYIVVLPTDTASIDRIPPTPERVIIEQIPLPLIPTVSSVALCDPGDTVLSGSYVTNGSALKRSFEPLDTLNGWNVTAELVLRGESGSVTADAECFDNPPLR